MPESEIKVTGEDIGREGRPTTPWNIYDYPVNPVCDLGKKSDLPLSNSRLFFFRPNFNHLHSV